MTELLLLPDAAIRAYVGRLRHAARPDPKNASLSRLDFLERELLTATARARRTQKLLDSTGTPVANAKSSNFDNVRRGAAALLIEDENGNIDSVPMTSVEAQVLPHLDDIRELHDWLIEDLQIATAQLVTMAASYQLLITRIDHLARISSVLSRPDAGGAGSCQACGTNVSGAANDRLRSGYCGACHRAWTRAGRPDRSRFRRTRTRSA